MTRITSSRSSQTIVSECVWHLAGRDFYSAAALDRLLTSSLTQSKTAVEQPPYKSLEELARDLDHLCSPQELARRLDALAEAGWLERHGGPKAPQYRIKLQGVERSMRELGWDQEEAPVLTCSLRTVRSQSAMIEASSIPANRPPGTAIQLENTR